MTENELSIHALHSVLDAIDHPEMATMQALQALGELKVYLREREADLVTRARQESKTWEAIAHALRRSPDLMDILYGRRPDER